MATFFITTYLQTICVFYMYCGRSFVFASPPPGLLYVGFSACMFGLYSFMPVVIKKTSATAVNLSLLTADLYSLFCGLFLFHYKVNCVELYVWMMAEVLSMQSNELAWWKQ